MNKQTYAARRDKLRSALEEKGVDALLVSHAANRFYLSGFELHNSQCNASAGMLLITRKGGDWLLTDSRYHDAAKRLWDEDRIFIYGQPAHEQMGDFLQKVCPGSVGFESQAMSCEFHSRLAQHKSALTPLSGLVEKLRIIKEPAEIEAMRRSCALNHKVFEQAQRIATPGMTEKELAWEVEQLYRNQGASELAFSTIVAVGANGALPHAIPGDDRISNDSPLLLDKGCRLDDYCSDQTRTFWVGDTPTDEFTRALEQTREAQEKAIQIIRPGESIAEAYRVARAAFEAHGVAEHFTHALGHGIGLETHEGLSISPKATGVFESGMIVTVEPGLYYPEWGGIRWEHMVLVTADGHEVL
ncbi:MAG: Xaa-Pro peptidase family protein [Proteobacteria bacterium]|nr:Xaa-Pro peptidase family protein [Pseudomonadota bacterium]